MAIPPSTALAVGKRGRNRVTLSYRGADFGWLRLAWRQQFLEEAESEQLIRVLRETIITHIMAGSVARHARRPLTIPNQFVFVLVAANPPRRFSAKLASKSSKRLSHYDQPQSHHFR
ncbi:MAG: hypothetical protein R2762_14390 [Bryobacteraceae bacterium]